MPSEGTPPVYAQLYVYTSMRLPPPHSSDEFPWQCETSHSLSGRPLDVALATELPHQQ